MQLSLNKVNNKATETFNKYLHNLSHFALPVREKSVSIQVQLPVCLEFLPLALGREQLLKKCCNLIQFSRNVPTLVFQISVCSCFTHCHRDSAACLASAIADPLLQLIFLGSQVVLQLLECVLQSGHFVHHVASLRGFH